MRVATATLASIALLAACSGEPTSPISPNTEPENPDLQQSDIIPGQFIVVLREGGGPSAAPDAVARLIDGEVIHIYSSALSGFAGRFSAETVEQLRRNPAVRYVEPDRMVRLTTTQTSATWGLDRIDQTALPLSTSYSYTSSGSGVTAYIIDTGILANHSEFGSRASVLYDAIGDGRNGVDCNGHGTHVAGTIGGVTYGVAKTVSLRAVRVLDCGGSGSYSGVIAGIDAVTANHTGSQPAVANMSLGGGFSQAVNDAVTRSIADGVVYAVAAGNGSAGGIPQDACNSSPASTPNALTVGATDKTDREASFSNYGTCVDLLAPGVGITSSWYSSTTATKTISGTSMATPHVAGAAARYLSSNPAATPAQVATFLGGQATTNVITLNSRSRTRGTPNKLLFLGSGQ